MINRSIEKNKFTFVFHIMYFRFVACFVDTEWFMEVVATAFYLDDCLALCGYLSDDVVLPQKRRVITRREWVDFLVDGILRLVFAILVFLDFSMIRILICY